MKDLMPDECTRTPKCASAPSQSMYSDAFGLATAMVLWLSFGLRSLPAIIRLLPPSGHRVVDNPGDTPRRLADMFVGQMRIALG